MKKGVKPNLGLFWKPMDVGYFARRSEPVLKLNDIAKVVVGKRLEQPETFPEFSTLFHRLILVYAETQVEKLKEVVEYFNRLLHRHTLKMNSAKAIIAYDHSRGVQCAGTWDWLTYDDELMSVVSAEFPLLKTTYPKFSESERNNNGTCQAWNNKNKCVYEKRNIGCYFAHWCTKSACRGDRYHRSDECPNKDKN